MICVISTTWTIAVQFSISGSIVESGTIVFSIRAKTTVKPCNIMKVKSEICKAMNNQHLVINN